MCAYVRTCACVCVRVRACECVFMGPCIIFARPCFLQLQSNIDYPTTSGQWPMDRCSDKGNVPDKENVNVCTLHVPHIEGCRKLRLVMSLSYLYTPPYSPYKQCKHYKYDVLVMFCICTCTRTTASTLI